MKLTKKSPWSLVETTHASICCNCSVEKPEVDALERCSAFRVIELIWDTLPGMNGMFPSSLLLVDYDAAHDDEQKMIYRQKLTLYFRIWSTMDRFNEFYRKQSLQMELKFVKNNILCFTACPREWSLQWSNWVTNYNTFCGLFLHQHRSSKLFQNFALMLTN